MAGGPGNPMGARALYLGATVYRIHGTNQPETIGNAVSSGCFRLANGDVIDLFARVPVGTKVIIRHAAPLTTLSGSREQKPMSTRSVRTSSPCWPVWRCSRRCRPRCNAATLDDVRQRGTLDCGVSQGLAGFSEQDAQGAWSGFDVDFCRAVAAAVLGDAAKVSFVPLSASRALRGAADGQDRRAVAQLDLDAGARGDLGLLFAGITYHDGQGFMVMRKPDVDLGAGARTAARSACRPAPPARPTSPTSSAPIR